MKNKILVSISGWGSDQDIFEELFCQCPELQNYQHIPLPWQNFVGPNKKSLLSGLQERLKEHSNSHLQELVLLGWSLGSMLCLELALQLDTTNIALILLAPSAAMCTPATTAETKDMAQNVNPLVLKLMQRKLQQNSEQVLRDFAHNCEASLGKFISSYLKRANKFLASEPQSLHAGLDYLIHCNLRKDLPIDIPCLLASGLHDKIIPTSQTAELARLMPQAELLQINAGHNLLLPPPEELIKAIQKFLKRIKKIGKV